MKINLKKIEGILSHYRGRSDAVIPVLQEIQEKIGWVPPEVIGHVADALKVYPSEVYGVATFYAQFHLKPRGKYIVKVCRGTACHVRGAKPVLENTEKTLGISDGQTSDDLKFTIETVACLGACAMGPVMTINQTYFGKMVPKNVKTTIQQSTE